MDYDVDYEVYRYLDKQAEQYVPFDELLKQHHLTYPEATQKVRQFKDDFLRLLGKYHIGNGNFVRLCYDLIDCIQHEPDNPELQYLYFCIVTDFGLLNEINSYDRTEEQGVRNYLRQNERIQTLLEFQASQTVCLDKLLRVQEYTKHTLTLTQTDCAEESDLLYHLTVQHTFLYGSVGNEVYRDNLHGLLLYLNSDSTLQAVKPYLLFASLTRKHGMIQKRPHFVPNLQSLFQYQAYNIQRENGKNFNNYQSYLELYDHLRRFYLDDDKVDMGICDFCFANLCPLSMWFYQYCQPDMDIPMTLKQKVQSLEPVSFPMLFCYDDYSNYDLGLFEQEYPDIYRMWEKTIEPEITESFLQALYHNSDIAKSVSVLPYYKQYPRYAELFLFQYGEPLLEQKMLDVSERFIEIPCQSKAVPKT